MTKTEHSPSEFGQRVYQSITRAAWALFLVTLPVTSFPFFPRAFGGAALVRPLSIYPLLFLIVLVTLPRLFSASIPRTLMVLVPFILVAITSSLLSTLAGIEPALGISVGERVLRGLVTLGLGAALYFTVALFPRSEDDLEWTLRWIYLGLGIALLWGSLQAIYIIHFDRDYFQQLLKWQQWISTRRLFTTRVSGMTYEPNWFAEQITFLYLPWLYSSILSDRSVFRLRWHRLTVEWLLFIWAIIVLAFTYSRAGIAAFLVIAFIGLLFFRPTRPASAQSRSKSKSWGRKTIEASLFVFIFMILVFAAGSKNTFFARLWSYWSESQNTSLSGYLEYIGFSSRFAYSQAAYTTYEHFPVLGVGVGNYAFYFSSMLPDRPIATTPELLRIVTPSPGKNRLITPKNFYLRILAETGLVGAAAFAAFLVALLGCALYLWLSPDSKQSFWGRGGMLGLISFGVAAFSFDSFSIPNMWVIFGLITVAAWVSHRQDARAASTLPNQTRGL